MRLIAIVYVVIMLGYADAATITVGPNDCDFTSIQNAINGANNGDIIKIMGDGYSENLIINKSLTLSGNNKAKINVDNRIVILADGITIEGLDITRGSSDSIIEVLSKGNIIKNNRIEATIYFDNSSNNLVTNNEIETFMGFGIWLTNSSNNILRNNAIYCLWIYGGDNNSIESNTIGGISINRSIKNYVGYNKISALPYPYRHFGGAVELKESDINDIIRNEIWGAPNECGLSLEKSNKNIISGNVINSTSIMFQGIVIIESLYNSIDNNIISGTDTGIILVEGSKNNDILANRISYYIRGINLYNVEDNLIVSNILLTELGNKFWSSTNEYRIGINAKRSNNNTLYLNIMFGNDEYNVIDSDGENIWDNGTIGNYYSNFDRDIEGCHDQSMDMICDYGYHIPGGLSFDRFPLSNIPDCDQISKYIITM